MEPSQKDPRRMRAVWRAIVEVSFIIFLFYSNLLMGKFTRSNEARGGLLLAIQDTITVTNFAIALTAALIGYVVVKYLREKL